MNNSFFLQSGPLLVESGSAAQHALYAADPTHAIAHCLIHIPCVDPCAMRGYVMR